MADTKVSALTSMAKADVVAASDCLYIIDATGPASKKIPVDQLPIDATQIGTGTVTSTEFGYIGGLTSDAQTQLDTKATSSLDTALADLGYTGTTRTLGVSGTVAVGTWCMYVNSAGTPLFGPVDTSDVTKVAVGVCVAVDGTNRTVLLGGRYRNDTVYAALDTAGVTIFRHVDTDGELQVTTPAGSTKARQILGMTEGNAAGHVIMVNPQWDVFTIA